MEEHDGLLFAERDSTEWHTAWNGLIAEGLNPNNYMLMSGQREGDSIVWGFKHYDTRKYTPITVSV